MILCMPAKGPVSLTRQTIYCFIPIMDLYASYKIKKLRWYLLIMLGLGLAMGAVSGVINPQPEQDDPELYMDGSGNVDWSKIWFGSNAGLSVGTFVMNIAIALAVAIYLIRRWSKKWNESFLNSD